MVKEALIAPATFPTSYIFHYQDGKKGQAIRPLACKSTILGKSKGKLTFLRGKNFYIYYYIKDGAWGQTN